MSGHQRCYASRALVGIFPPPPPLPSFLSSCSYSFSPFLDLGLTIGNPILQEWPSMSCLPLNDICPSKTWPWVLLFLSGSWGHVLFCYLLLFFVGSFCFVLFLYFNRASAWSHTHNGLSRSLILTGRLTWTENPWGASCSTLWNKGLSPFSFAL